MEINSQLQKFQFYRQINETEAVSKGTEFSEKNLLNRHRDAGKNSQSSEAGEEILKSGIRDMINSTSIIYNHHSWKD